MNEATFYENLKKKSRTIAFPDGKEPKKRGTIRYSFSSTSLPKNEQNHLTKQSRKPLLRCYQKIYVADISLF